MKVKRLLTRTAGAFGVTAGLLFVGSPLMAQVKIGDNPNMIDSNSILELESTNKGFLQPRVALVATNNVAPMTAPVPEGMRVYNTATTSGTYGVSPGEYYYDGRGWVRLVTAIPYGQEVFRQGPAPVGASCGSDPEGTIWNDILENSPTEGQQWICRVGVWEVYNAPSSSTPFFAKLTKDTDAGARKAGTINRLGHIVVRRDDDGASTTITPGGGIRLLRTLALAPNHGAFVDFARSPANPDLFRIGLRNDLNDGNGALTFQSSLASGNFTPRMLIGLNGQIGVNVTDPKSRLHVEGTVLITENSEDGAGYDVATGGKNGIKLYYDSTANRAQIFVQADASDPNVVLSKKVDGGGTVPNGSIFQKFQIPSGTIGSVTREAGLTVKYNETSDRRLKENIKNTHYTIEDLMRIAVVDYNYKSDAAKTRMPGFIAQDLYEVYPRAVTKGGENPKTSPWMVDYGKLTPLLVKAVQDQQKEIASLKAQLSEMHALKAEVASIKAMLGNAEQLKSEATISK
ncbi:tail fiber domain-containing protein [Dyadobacter sp. 676]|uniref:Tail fiber domain-containing protein n=1 Tax=Dyadobacter sp. 676 TaxID=3088362 RepID=A0AAU8FCP8_9BACT